MVRCRLGGCLLAIALSLAAGAAHADCSMDTDCKGDRVCDGGKCVEPAALPPAPPAPPGSEGAPGAAPAAAAQPSSAALPAAASAPVAASAPASSVPPAAPRSMDSSPRVAGNLEAPAGEATPEPETRRRNKPMMVGGIVMVSVGPLLLLGALAQRDQQRSCELERGYRDPLTSATSVAAEDCTDYDVGIYGLALAGTALIGLGIPMIVIGGKNVPVQERATGRVLPWVTPSGAGARLRIDL